LFIFFCINTTKKLDGRRREAIDGSASTWAHGGVAYFTGGKRVIQWRGFCLGRRDVSVVFGIGIEKKISWERLPEGEVTRGRGARGGSL